MSKLVRFDPFAEMDALQRHFFNDDNWMPRQVRSVGLPTTDVYMKDNALVVEVHLPKFDEDDVNISVENGNLVIQAQRHEKEEDKENLSELFRQVEPDDLMKFGLIPEFIGRLPMIAPLSELDEEALIQILTQPKNALTKQYQALFGLEDVELEFTPEALKAMAKKALERKTGARGLRSIVEAVLLDTMYDLPSIENLQKVIVDEETIVDNKPPKLEYKN